MDFCKGKITKLLVDYFGNDFRRITHALEVLKYSEKFNKPLILSKGMATLSEIENAIRIIEERGNREIIILHCIAVYPPKLNDINLNPSHNLASNLVYSANGTCVDTTICNGKILMQNRKVEGEEEILRKANEIAFKLIDNKSA